MLLLAAAALAASTAPQGQGQMRVAPLIQAQATVRIVRGVTVQLGRETTTDGQQLRSTQIATADGTQPARLIEFQ